MLKTLAEEFVAQRTEMKGTINAQMGMRLLEVDEEQQEVSFLFPVEPWQFNPFGTMHGGMIATLADMAMGCAAYACNGGHSSPTAEMQIRYLKGIHKGSAIRASAKVLHAGRNFSQVRVDLYQNEGLVAEASGIYVTLSKEGKEIR